MKKKLLTALISVTSLSFIPQVSAGEHLMEYKHERRGDNFERNFAELHSSWGKVGPGILMTTLELTGISNNGKGDTHIHPGFAYLIPVAESFLVGPVAKYNYVADGDDALKAGLGWAYLGFGPVSLGGQFRYDYSFSDNGIDIFRTDLAVGFPLMKDLYLNTITTHFEPEIIDSWQEMELEFKYTGFEGIHPYIGTTLTTDGDPLGRGDNAFILGFYIPFK